MRVSVATALAALVLVLPSLQAAGPSLSKPEDVGLSSERLRRIEPIIKAHIAAKDLTGAVTLVARRGKVVHFAAFGTTDLDTKAPMRTDTLFRLASMTKPVTAVATLTRHSWSGSARSTRISRLPEALTPVIA